MGYKKINDDELEERTSYKNVPKLDWSEAFDEDDSEWESNSLYAS
jgi:hypothetical protein|tara:strand:+ start:1246 stop:1380 length:135 start_codon:yes stop_codon:yes gene_type:complete